jgi:hypothetical protein
MRVELHRPSDGGYATYIVNSCAPVRGYGVVFRHYYRSLAKRAGKDFHDGAVVPSERF